MTEDEIKDEVKEMRFHHEVFLATLCELIPGFKEIYEKAYTAQERKTKSTWAKRNRDAFNRGETIPRRYVMGRMINPKGEDE